MPSRSPQGGVVQVLAAQHRPHPPEGHHDGGQHVAARQVHEDQRGLPPVPAAGARGAAAERRQRRGAAVAAAGPLDQVQAAARHTAALQQELGQLQRELGSFDITATRRPVNSVQMKDVSSNKSLKIVSIPIVALAAGASCFYLWHSLK